MALQDTDVFMVSDDVSSNATYGTNYKINAADLASYVNSKSTGGGGGASQGSLSLPPGHAMFSGGGYNAQFMSTRSNNPALTYNVGMYGGGTAENLYRPPQASPAIPVVGSRIDSAIAFPPAGIPPLTSLEMQIDVDIPMHSDHSRIEGNHAQISGSTLNWAKADYIAGFTMRLPGSGTTNLHFDSCTQLINFRVSSNQNIQKLWVGSLQVCENFHGFECYGATQFDSEIHIGAGADPEAVSNLILGTHPPNSNTVVLNVYGFDRNNLNAAAKYHCDNAFAVLGANAYVFIP